MARYQFTKTMLLAANSRDAFYKSLQRSHLRLAYHPNGGQIIGFYDGDRKVKF